jgi:hypothetical protein
MFKWLCAVLFVSVSAAGYEIYWYREFAGLGIGILLLPAFISSQWMIARVALPKPTKRD